MGTVKEEFELLKSKILAGKENETIHVVWHEAERRRKREKWKQQPPADSPSYKPRTGIWLSGRL